MKVHGASTDELVDGGVRELEVDEVENSRRVLSGRFIGQPASAVARSGEATTRTRTTAS